MKGIIVADKIPESCRKTIREGGTGCPFGGMVCSIKNEDVMEYLVAGKKPDWCPIKPVPKKFKKETALHGIYDIIHETSRMGWNACIDEILGVEENE